MSDHKKTVVHDIMIAEKYNDKKDGSERVMYFRAGVAFSNSRGGMNCEVTPGLALTGRFVIFPRKEGSHPSDRSARDPLE